MKKRVRKVPNKNQETINRIMENKEPIDVVVKNYTWTHEGGKSSMVDNGEVRALRIIDGEVIHEMMLLIDWKKEEITIQKFTTLNAHYITTSLDKISFPKHIDEIKVTEKK